MKYSVGQKVRVKSIDWYNENKNKYGEIGVGNGEYNKCMKDYCGKVMTIHRIIDNRWYIMKETYIYTPWTDEMIECKVEEEIEFTEEDKYWCDIMSESDPTTYVLPQGYQFVDENGNVINATKIVLEKKTNEYPKTYEECCKVLGWNHRDYDRVGYKSELLCKLQVLLLCRDVYWQIAGEEMGLGKPWEPNYNSLKTKYTIEVMENKVVVISTISENHILAFPTEEMRDAFYENFKELINSCKELL